MHTYGCGCTCIRQHLKETVNYSVSVLWDTIITLSVNCQWDSDTLGYQLEIFKTESTRKLSNFDFPWTKTLYQNNLKHLHSFLPFSRAKDVISHP